MKKSIIKLIFQVIFIVSLGLLFSTEVHATEKINQVVTINGVREELEYTLNSSNEIIELKCKNVNSLVGEVYIPSSIDGKKVVSIANYGFAEAKSMTSVIIPESAKTIGYKAFANCKSLKNVNLRNVEKLANSVFANCTELESIKIPKTLIASLATFPEEVFGGCTKLTKITFEDGITTIPSALCAKTHIREVELPSSVKTLGYKAFSDCKELVNVNLGNVETVANCVFENCTALNNVKIPKTLTKSSATFPEDVFGGCTNLTSITFEDGLTTIPSALCAKTHIKEVKLPDSVKTIGYKAFSDCKELTKVNLGKVEKIANCVFENCTALNNVKIPKTLNTNSATFPEDVFGGCTNLTKITFEDGITTIPSAICAKTLIQEIALPSSVKTIGYKAFADCSKLKNILILDNVKNIGSSNSSSETVFQNHNTELTIYCYKDSVAEKYAKAHNIKYKNINKPAKILKLKVKSQGTDYINLKWNKDLNAAGYQIYMYNSEKNKYERVGQTTKTTYKVKNLKPGTIYKFKVRGYAVWVNTKVTGEFSNVLKTTTKPEKVNFKSLSKENGNVVLEWKKQNGNGYEVYMATSKNGNYKNIKTLNKNKTVKLTIMGLNQLKDKKFFFKIRAYSTVNGKKVYGEWSKIKSIKVK